MNDYWSDEAKVGATNIYLSVKPVFEIQENKFIDKIYFLRQLGYGMTRFDVDGYEKYNKNELYWAIGAGVEKSNIVVELIYSVNYFEIKDWDDAFSSRRLAINAGYKFSL